MSPPTPKVIGVSMRNICRKSGIHPSSRSTSNLTNGMSSFQTYDQLINLFFFPFSCRQRLYPPPLHAMNYSVHMSVEWLLRHRVMSAISLEIYCHCLLMRRPGEQTAQEFMKQVSHGTVARILTFRSGSPRFRARMQLKWEAQKRMRWRRLSWVAAAYVLKPELVLACEAIRLLEFKIYLETGIIF